MNVHATKKATEALGPKAISRIEGIEVILRVGMSLIEQLEGRRPQRRT